MRPFLPLVTGLLGVLPASLSQAQDGRTRAIPIHATTQASFAQITVNWETHPHPVIHRRLLGSGTWTDLGNDSASTATAHIEANVSPGIRYESRVYHQYVSTVFTASALSSTSLAAWLADPDTDSFLNLLEYALDLDPRSASAQAFLPALRTPPPLTSLSLSFAPSPTPPTRSSPPPPSLQTSGIPAAPPRTPPPFSPPPRHNSLT